MLFVFDGQVLSTSHGGLKPPKPDSTRQWDVTFYWMLSLPNKVWETDYRKRGLLPSQLREIIIANALKMK